MAIATWQHWLRSALSLRAPGSRRRNTLPPVAGLESLEQRTLLTAPTVIDGYGTPTEDQAYPGTVALLGSDADGNTLTYKVVSNVTHGTLTFSANGVFSYTSSLDYNGPDSFTFEANDGTDDSNVGTFFLTVNPVNDPLKLAFPSGVAQVPRNSSPVRIDPAAVVGDVDTPIDYANTQIRALISTGNSPGDTQKGRVILTVQNQEPGPFAVTVKGTNIYYNGSTSPIATFSGGSLGRALVIKFRNTATLESVNAVLKQISLQASKKATSLAVTASSGGITVTTFGSRLVDVTVSAGGQKVLATKQVSII